jgi:hypothetical protein
MGISRAITAAGTPAPAAAGPGHGPDAGRRKERAVREPVRSTTYDASPGRAAVGGAGRTGGRG